MKIRKKEMLILGIIIIFSFGCLLLIIQNNNKKSDFVVRDESSNIQNAKKYGDNVTGWLRVEGTNIDFALIGKNPETAINFRDYEFAWTNSFPDEKSNHFTYISHNVRNVSSKPIVGDNKMTYFEQLMSFIYPNFIKENQFIEFTGPDGETSIYKIFGVALVDEPQYSSYYDTFTKKELDKYIKKAKNESMYNLDVPVDSSDMLLTLYTCTRFYGDSNYSFRIDARKLREGENMKYSMVETNKNYEKISKRMKEGDQDEEV